MKIRFLGTAAYEGIPSLFCNCAVCSGARKAGGRNLRSRSQAIVNGELLLDFPADTLWHAQRFGLDWNAIGSCLITHPHSDHFYPEDMVMGRPDFCHDNRSMNYYLPAAAELRLRQEIAATGLSDMQGRIVPHRVEPFCVFETMGYRVLPLAADHPTAKDPLFYAIEKDGKRLLYAHDTGYFPEDSWQALRSFGKFGLVSMDCTGGAHTDWRQNHMCLTSNAEVADRLRKEGLADANTVFVANHFSHNGGASYDKLCEIALKYGIVISYDGLEIEF